MENIIFRKAVKSDIKKINEIINYSIKNTTYTLQTMPQTINDTTLWYELHKKENYPIIVATKDKSVVGWASLSRFRTFNGYDKTAELSIYVDNAFKRKGIAENLLTRIEAEARELNFHTIISVITSTNIPSINLHKKKKFELNGKFKEIAFKNGKYIDVFMFTKIID